MIYIDAGLSAIVCIQDVNRYREATGGTAPSGTNRFSYTTSDEGIALCVEHVLRYFVYTERQNELADRTELSTRPGLQETKTYAGAEIWLQDPPLPPLQLHGKPEGHELEIAAVEKPTAQILIRGSVIYINQTGLDLLMDKLEDMVNMAAGTILYVPADELASPQTVALSKLKV